MCLINFQYYEHPQFKLIVVANRDEEYSRPSAKAHYWEDEPSILAGRDLLQMGTWLGVSKEGNFAAITNYRDPSMPLGTKSRGEIIKNFLSSKIPVQSFVEKLRLNRKLYGGYNVLLYDGEGFVHYNNVLDEVNFIEKGTHSLSNHSLNTPWPKVVKGKAQLKAYLDSHPKDIHLDDLFKIVSDETEAPEDDLPNTGVGIELEKHLSPLFIKLPTYGTRTSTILLISHENEVTFVERTFYEGKFQFDTKYNFFIK